MDPLQYSKFLVRRLNPKVPSFAFLGLPRLFQDGIVCWKRGAETPNLLVISLLISWRFLNRTGFSSTGVNAASDGETDGEMLRLAE